MQQNNQLLTTVLLMGVLFTSGVYARQSNETLSRFYLQLQSDSGSNSLDATSGSESVSFDLGDGMAISAGYDFYNELDWKIRLGIGYKRNNFSGYTFTALPMDFLLIYDKGAIEYGIGVSYQLEPTINQSNGDFNFDTQAGYVLQLELELAKHLALGARYTGISYSRGDASGDKIKVAGQEAVSNIDADYASLYIRFVF